MGDFADQRFVLPQGPAPLSLSQPGLLEVLSDLDALGLWEVIRSHRSPRSIGDLADETALGHARVQRLADSLEAQGLLRKLPASRRRRHGAYAVTRQRIEVVFDSRNPMLRDEFKRLAVHLHGQFAKLLDRRLRWPDRARGEWRFGYCGTERLSPSDLAELQRRIRAVAEFWNALGGARRARRRGAPGATAGGSHAMTIRVEAMDGAVLPLPEVWFRDIEHARISPGPRTGRSPSVALSPRELQAARLLASGAKRSQVARALGVSPGTVGTMCKRIYHKLCVCSQAQLASVLRA